MEMEYRKAFDEFSEAINVDELRKVFNFDNIEFHHGKCLIILSFDNGDETETDEYSMEELVQILDIIESDQGMSEDEFDDHHK